MKIFKKAVEEVRKHGVKADLLMKLCRVSDLLNPKKKCHWPPNSLKINDIRLEREAHFDSIRIMTNVCP